MAHNSLRVVPALLLVCAVGMTDASAATLKAKALRDWETYVQSTERRINGEYRARPHSWRWTGSPRKTERAFESI